MDLIAYFMYLNSDNFYYDFTTSDYFLLIYFYE